MKKTLVIQRARLGDLIQTLPLLESISLQGDHVTLLVSEDLLDSARLLFPSGDVQGFPGSGSVFRNQNTSLVAGVPRLRDVWAALDSGSWDRIIQLNHDPTGVLLGQLLRAKQRRGFVSFLDRRVSGLESLPPVGWPAYLVSSARSVRAVNRIHLSDIWRGFAQEEESPLPGGFRESRIDSLVNGSGNRSANGPIGVVLSGRSRYREFSFDALSSLIDGIRKKSGRPVVLLGRPDERELSLRLARTGSGTTVYNRVGETSLSDLISQVEELSLLISPDTATLHLAALKRTPSLGVFFGNAQPHETGAYSDGAFSLTPEMDCYPCAGEGSACSHLSCRSLFSPDYLVNLSLAIVERMPLPAPPDGLRLWKGKRVSGRFSNRPAHPVWAVREDLLGILYRRFYLRILDPGTSLPSLESEWEGYRGEDKMKSVLGSLATGSDLLSRLLSPDSIERVRLAGEFPMLWPILNHTEQIECGRGNRSLQSNAFSLLALESSNLSGLCSGKRNGSQFGIGQVISGGFREQDLREREAVR
ncbi:MAG: glycosyltransferase family 9 protein [Leptospirales bacterium]